MALGATYPDWTQNRPVDSEYYLGIGVVSTKESNYREKAKESAIKEISSQIYTDVISQTSRTTSEKNDIAVTEFSENSDFFTFSELSNLEIVDSKKVSGEYWVLCRLNKSEYSQRREKKINLIKGGYEASMLYDADTDKLQYLVPAYEELLKIPDDEIIFSDKNLRIEIPKMIQSIINGFRLSQNFKRANGKQGLAIADSLEVRVKGTYKSAVRGVPIRFEYLQGEGDLEKDIGFTNQVGMVSNKIMKVISTRPDQRLRAFIDLAEYREKPVTPNVLIEDKIEKLTMSNSVIFQFDIRTLSQEEVAVIVVGDTSVFSNKDLKRLNQSFRDEFSQETEYKLKDEAFVDGILDEYKRSSKLCTSESCQMIIGSGLGVQKLIFVDLTDYSDQTRVTIFLRDIVNKELILEKTYPLKRNPNATLTEKIALIEKNIDQMVQDYWIRQNPAFLTLKSQYEVVTNMTYNQPTEWMDKKLEIELPVYDKPLYRGTYDLTINQLGFEPYEQRIQLSRGEYSELFIDIKKKQPKTAFKKSLLIPGRGQFYSSDENNRSRKMVGILFFSAWVGSSIAMGASWSQYFVKQKEYQDANETYLKQKILEEVMFHRAIAEQKNEAMFNQQTSAVVITSIWSVLWIGNAIEARLNFPKYDYRAGKQRFSFNSSIDPFTHSINLDISF